MNIQRKLDEARYFLCQMENCVADYDSFSFNFSAFLTAARSVVQYTERETKRTGRRRGNQSNAWFKSVMQAEEIIRFFQNLRDENIHQTPVRPNKSVSITLSGELQLYSSIKIQKYDETGKLVEEFVSGDGSPEPKTPTPPKIDHFYTFADQPDKDVLSMSKQYFQALETMIADGQERGFISTH